MGETHTQQAKETTIYRILGGGHAEIVESLLRDAFTRTLLVMVLVTNFLIILIPVSVHAFNVGVAKGICYTIALSMLPGYAVLLYFLVTRFRQSTPVSQQFAEMDRGQLTLSQAPRLRNTIVGIQCLLFASLLCSTFLMRQQLTSLNASDEVRNERVIVKEPTSEIPGTPLLPLLRQYISM